MILIYNLSGLLVGSAGVLVGLMLTALSGRLWVGLLGLAVVWMVLGFVWRRQKSSEGLPRPYPAVFFIPLPFLAMAIVPLALLISLIERVGDGRTTGQYAATGQDDPRAALLRNDERSLNEAQYGGDVELSRSFANALAATLTQEAKADEYHVFTRVNADNLLVLVKIPNLKLYKPNAREQLLGAIAGVAAGGDALKDKKLYIGIKGKIAFGAIRLPPDRIETGSVLRETPLYAFYESNPAAAATNPAIFSGYGGARGAPAHQPGAD